ncbi:tripartite tricarboxylate transporter substrate binding protein [Caenimonas sp. SL110]|uniref:Bug family tripartite tricarboxylate transporter substrate binding protein n=1 Tax=Caenimonas sp. SL110 TaxID=1450524 RepID=UPI0006529814|nr:tripartite tricarboxylate transporter substrate binding protein [Caenimonas sp. SL110]
MRPPSSQPLSSRRRGLVLAATGAAITGMSPWTASAQSAYPDKPVRIVVPFGAGGSDTLARALGEKLSAQLKQPVLVENKPGAAALIGSEYVASQPADGHTILFLGGGSLTPVLIKDLKFNLLKSMRPVVCVARGGMTLMVPGTLPVNNFREFVEYAKKNPGKVNFSYTAGSILLAAEMLKSRAGFDAVAIPYKGSTQVATALVAGEIQMGIDVPLFYVGMIKEGRIKALAHGAAERSPSLPDVPTLAEVGVPDLAFAFSFGFWAPAGTPDPIVNRLNVAFNEVLKEPDIRARLVQAGVVPVGGAPEVHSRQVSAEQQMWAQAASKIGYKPE